VPEVTSARSPRRLDPSRDELARGRREAAELQRQALPRWRRALRFGFDPANNVSVEERARLVGAPTSRRDLFRLGGTTLAAGAVLAACGASDDETMTLPQTGSLPPTQSSTTTAPASRETDQILVVTAQSLELLAVQTYDAALDSDALGTPALRDVAELFRDQHREHAELLAALGRDDLGVSAVTEPNAYLDEMVVQPALAELAESETDEERERGALELALLLEDSAQQTYVVTTGEFSTAELRQASISIGAVEARHVSVILGALAEPQVPFALARTAGAVPEEAYLGPDGQPLD